MKLKLSNIKIFAVVALVLSVSIASAYFTGSTSGKGGSKFSLKNLNKLKGYSYVSLRNYSNLKGTSNTNYQRSGSTIISTSLASYQKGNITYVLPYQAKIKFTKFVTPKAPAIR